LAAKFAEVFERELVPREPTLQLVKVLVHDGRRVLLLHRRAERGNFWQPVTGTIEPGEDPLATARRELVEETGHSGEPEPLGLAQSFMIESQYLAARYTDRPILAGEIAFHIRVDSAQSIRIDRTEHDDYAWFTFDEAYARIRWTDDREALERLVRIVQPPPVTSSVATFQIS
ncbi:MAG TPA: NUDIX domain-containing protein, partial [Thermoanaerobaculia bacterium]|nr:NUDIX domain-containing protein [Thermoanaerobaculia bacterium]